MQNIESFYQQLLVPSKELIEGLKSIEGDIIILGAGGKMGPALTRLTKQAIDQAGINKKIIAVSRFSEPGLEKQLTEAGITTINADLLEDDQLNALPDVKNVLYLVGVKFGTYGNESFTWVMNAYLPGRIAQKYKHSNIVAFSTGNVYPLTPAEQGGARESMVPNPVGEYGQSCLGRERVFQYYASKYNIPLFIYRLNYANDVSYGVLLEIAKSVKEKRPINLSMGSVNVIWQGDANEFALRALKHCSVPARIVNITGPETLSVRWLAEEFGRMFGQTPEFINEEQPTALLSNASESSRLFGYPKVSVKQMMELLVEWVNQGGKTSNIETHFQERTGKF